MRVSGKLNALIASAGISVGGAKGEVGERKDYLDGWRGLAILLVLESHFVKILPLNAGRLGVDLFFCLSGFLMAGILFIQRQPLQKFYKRRISRIFPAFTVFVILVFLLSLMSGVQTSWGEFVSTLFFWRTYTPAQPGIWGSPVPIGHLWSLNIEEHSYVLMSLILLCGIRRGRDAWVLLLIGLSCLVMGVAYVKLGDRAPHWGVIGTEVAASHLFLSSGYRLWRERVGLRVPSWMPLLALLVGVYCYSSLAPWWASSLVSPFVLAFAVNHLSDIQPWFRQALSWQPVRQVGIWSFSIYLWQQPFYHHMSSIPGGAWVALCAAGLAGVMSFYWLEQPCREWLNRTW